MDFNRCFTKKNGKKTEPGTMKNSCTGNKQIDPSGPWIFPPQEPELPANVFSAISCTGNWKLHGNGDIFTAGPVYFDAISGDIKNECSVAVAACGRI